MYVEPSIPQAHRGAEREEHKKIRKERKQRMRDGERDREAGRKSTAKPESQGNQRQSLSSSDGGRFSSVSERRGEGEGAVNFERWSTALVVQHGEVAFQRSLRVGVGGIGGG